MYKPPRAARPERAVHVHVVLRRRQGRRRVDARHDLEHPRHADRHVRRHGRRRADRGAGSRSASVIVLDGKRRPDRSDRRPTPAARSSATSRRARTRYQRDRRRSPAPPTRCRSRSPPARRPACSSRSRRPRRIAVSAVDELGRHAPAKIQLLGHDRRHQDAIAGRPADVPVLARARRARAHRPRSTAATATSRARGGRSTAALEATVRPGTYDLVVARGPEYEVHDETVTIAAGSVRGRARSSCSARIDATAGSPATSTSTPRRRPTRGLPIAAARRELRRRGPRGRDRDRSQLHHRLRAGDRRDRARSVAARHPGHGADDVRDGPLHRLSAARSIPGSTRGGEFVWAGQPPQKLFDQLRDARDRSDDCDRPGRAPAPAGARLLRAVLRRRRRPRSRTRRPASSACSRRTATSSRPRTSATTSTRSSCITGRRIEDVHTFVAPNPLPPGPFPDPQPVPGQVVVGKDGRPTVPGHGRDLVHDARSRAARRPAWARRDSAPPARRRAGLRAHDAVRRRRQGHAGRLHARRRGRRDPRAPRDRDERAVHRR